MCTQDRKISFGEVVGADLVSARENPNDIARENLKNVPYVKLNNAGQIIERIYTETISSFKNVVSDNYIIMPNHIHCIISIHRAEPIQRADTRSAPTEPETKTICEIAQAFKSKTTVEYINGVKSGLYKTFNKRIWQRNYYEHIIRNEEEYRNICKYINENPQKWEQDKFYLN